MNGGSTDCLIFFVCLFLTKENIAFTSSFRSDQQLERRGNMRNTLSDTSSISFQLLEQTDGTELSW